MASKYDLFVFEDNGRRIVMVWDTAVDGVDQWRHWDSKRAWVVADNRHRSNAQKKWKLVERVPEGVWRYYGAHTWVK